MKLPSCGLDQPSGPCSSKRFTLVAALLAFAMLAIESRAGFVLYSVESASMEPTLHCAAGPGCGRIAPDRILVNRFTYDFRSISRGDIVVFTMPRWTTRRCGQGTIAVKRVIALPGETVEQKHGRIYVDGAALDEPYLRTSSRGGGASFSNDVPQRHYFLMGDNRIFSCDSRRFGPIAADAIRGKVIAVYSPRGSLRVVW
jgi:signal peptidase I